MSDSTPRLPQIYLARHGQTAWSETGQHTGSTDIPLNERGERNARRLGQRLDGKAFDLVLTSPLSRAARTCELAGYAEAAEVDADLVEWGYGEYEGVTSADIEAQRPGWELFRDGCPGGEPIASVSARVDRVIDRLRAVDGDALLFSHGHLLHVFAARWIGLDPSAGRGFDLGAGALSIVGYHRKRENPVVRLWNDCSHESD
ncbi:MAG: histidine phosphatase family protein [Planctomycetota bacterium]